jgi:ABC-type amino acid transport substrate-binding protein
MLMTLALPASSGQALRAGTTSDYAPLAFRQDGRIVGLEADLAAALAQRLGRPVELVELPWEGLIEALRAGDIDLIIAALRAREVDVFIQDAPTIWRVAAAPGEEELMGLFWPLTDEHLAWAVRQDDQTLREALDASIRAWREDGTLRAAVSRWIPVQVEVEAPSP